MEDVLKDAYWSSTDLMQYMIDKYENETTTERSPKWDLTPQNIWISNSLPKTSQLKFKKTLSPKKKLKLNHGNVLEQSKLLFTKRFSGPESTSSLKGSPVRKF